MSLRGQPQALRVPRDERFLLLAGPALELCFALQSCVDRRECFRIRHLDRSASRGVRRTAASVVAYDALGKVGRVTDIVGTIATAEDVNVVGHLMRPFDSVARSLAQGTIRLAMRCEGPAMSEPPGETRGESNGGGGGSRTRVRKRVAEGIYVRVRSCWFAPDVRERRETAGR